MDSNMIINSVYFQLVLHKVCFLRIFEHDINSSREVNLVQDFHHNWTGFWEKSHFLTSLLQIEKREKKAKKLEIYCICVQELTKAGLDWILATKIHTYPDWTFVM